jgi:hypothetical protein
MASVKRVDTKTDSTPVVSAKVGRISPVGMAVPEEEPSSVEDTIDGRIGEITSLVSERVSKPQRCE